MLAERIILALDVPTEEEALRLVSSIPDLRFVKVGMELFYACGNKLLAELKKRNLKVFLDLKLHDIPVTVARTVKVLGSLGIDIINLQCAGGFAMMDAARNALSGDTKLIGVTQLTSTDKRALNEELGIPGTVEDSVIHYAKLTKRAGLHGVVCSPLEVALIREHIGLDFLTVTPGVRPKSTGHDDQKRVMTPYEAIRKGSDYLVIGRAITGNPDPNLAFHQILSEIKEASLHG